MPDHYGETDEGGAATATAQPDESPPHEDKDDGSEDSDGMADQGETALVPKSMFAGKELKPGDEFIFKIVKDHGEGEVEIAYSTGKEAEHPKSQMDQSGDALEKIGKPMEGY